MRSKADSRTKEALAKRVQRQRELRSMSIRELSRLSGVSTHTIHRIEKQKENYSPTLETLDLLAEVFCMSASRLISPTIWCIADTDQIGVIYDGDPLLKGENE